MLMCDMPLICLFSLSVSQKENSKMGSRPPPSTHCLTLQKIDRHLALGVFRLKDGIFYDSDKLARIMTASFLFSIFYFQCQNVIKTLWL